MLNSHNPRAIIIGGSRGIGKAVTKMLIESGSHVVFTFNTDKKAAEQLIREAKSVSGQVAISLQLDVRKLETIGIKISEAVEKLGGLDYLVYSPGGVVIESVEHVSQKSWSSMMNTHVFGASEAMKFSSPHLVKSKIGSAVLISSISSLSPRPSQLAYSSAKAAMNQMARSYAEALASQGVRVNTVLPGLISTDAIKGVDADLVQKIIEDTPMKRLGVPTEIAESVIFLLSNRASFITGHSLVVSGGREMQ